MDRLQECIARVKEINCDVIIREARIEDGQDFVKLFNKQYNRKTNLDYYSWQFFKSSLISRLFMAYVDHELIGVYGVKINFLTNGIKTGFAVDFLVDESHRKKGISFLLEDAVQNFCLKNNVSILTALPNIYGRSAFRSMGWKSVAKIDSLVFNNSKIAMPVKTFNISDTHIVNQLISFEKNEQYHFWRFDQHPIYKYESIKIKNNVFAVIKKFENSLTGEIFGDIVHMESPIEEFDKLFALIMDKMMQMKISLVTTWALPHTKLHQILLEKGFEELAQERYFCVKCFGNEPDYLQIENWNIVQIDSEVY
tara:strand:- start:51 stop:980 length:930 start_codon:yes stop_codon:yes gene_type:complete